MNRGEVHSSSETDARGASLAKLRFTASMERTSVAWSLVRYDFQDIEISNSSTTVV